MSVPAPSSSCGFVISDEEYVVYLFFPLLSVISNQMRYKTCPGNLIQLTSFIFQEWGTKGAVASDPPPTDKHPGSTAHCTDTNMQMQFYSIHYETIVKKTRPVSTRNRTNVLIALRKSSAAPQEPYLFPLIGVYCPGEASNGFVVAYKD